MSTEASEAVSSRVRRHRSKMVAQGCQRLEITIGADVVAKMRDAARRQGRPLWQVVEDACEKYSSISGNGAKL